MHQYVRNLTVDVGKGNPGAVGLRFMTNNSGAMYDVTVRISDPERVGAIGLDLSCHQFGPGYIKNVTVIGFDRAVTTGSSFSMVLEHLTIEGQRKMGFHNSGANVTIRDLKSRNKVPAIVNDQRSITLTDATLNTEASSRKQKGFRSSCLRISPVRRLLSSGSSAWAKSGAVGKITMFSRTERTRC